MKTTLMAIGFASLLVVSGCGKHNSEYDTSSKATDASGSAAVNLTGNTSPEKLGEIGAEIKKHPDDAQKILSDHGMTMASFEKAIRSVSSDPEASRKYRDAYKKAGA